jgi:predicted ArsR family transcriptional regulator
MCDMPRAGRKRTVTDDELIEAVKAINGPFATGAEVAEAVGLSAVQARERLGGLYDDGVLDRKQAGSAVGYWVSSVCD